MERLQEEKYIIARSYKTGLLHLPAMPDYENQDAAPIDFPGPPASCARDVHARQWAELPRADAMVMAVAHRAFLDFGVEDLARKLVKGASFIDVKSAFDRASLTAAGFSVWRL